MINPDNKPNNSLPDADDPYAPGHVNDPVTEDAVRAAMAATDKPSKKRHPWFERLFGSLIVFVLLLGAVGAVVGLVNSLSLREANNRLRIEQQCLIRLDQKLQSDQAVRTAIADDDRQAIDDIVKAIREAKTKEQLDKAFSAYFKERAINDKNRANYQVQIPNVSTCSLEGADLSLPSGTDTPGASAVPSLTKSSAKKSKTKKSHNAGTQPTAQRTAGVSQPTARSSSNVVAPNPKPTPPVTKTKTKVVTKTKTATPPPPIIVTTAPGPIVLPIPILSILPTPICRLVGLC